MAFLPSSLCLSSLLLPAARLKARRVTQFAITQCRLLRCTCPQLLPAGWCPRTSLCEPVWAAGLTPSATLSRRPTMALDLQLPPSRKPGVRSGTLATLAAAETTATCRFTPRRGDHGPIRSQFGAQTPTVPTSVQLPASRASKLGKAHLGTHKPNLPLRSPLKRRCYFARLPRERSLCSPIIQKKWLA